MAAGGSKNLPTLGFFSITEHADWGIVGGLLVLNASGRPLEFHCTAPLKPNRAQEILYGPTLRPFLYGEQIGATLAAKAKSDALFLCTDSEPAMCLRDSIPTPLLLVLARETSPPAAASSSAGDGGKQRKLRFDEPQGTPRPAWSRLREFALGKQPVAVLEQHAGDRELIEQRWQPYAEHLDLVEPFSRIREALEEAQRGAAK